MSYVLNANRQRVEAAQAKLKAYNETSIEDRAATAKAMTTDEYAAMQGVVTINQAEATFIDLNVHAFNDMGDAFAEFVPLAIGQTPIYKLRQEFPVRVNMGHLGGGPPSVKFQTQQSGVQVVPFQYFSEQIEVPNLVNVAFDIGKFHEKEQALARIARDMKLARQQYIINLMLGQPLLQPLATSLATYYGSTPFNGRVPYVLDPTVDAASVVSTNILSLVSEGGLTRNVFKAIRSQMILTQRTPGSMFIPVSGKPWEAYWNQASIVALTTGQGNQNPSIAIPPSKWEEAVNMGFSENGMYMDWFGLHIWVQPVNILPQGYFLVSTNMPAVMGWDQMDATISEEDPLTGPFRQLAKRYEARSMALAQADPQLLNFVVGKLQ